MKNEYRINDDVHAEVRGNMLTVNSDTLDDFDVYTYVEGGWDMIFDSLSNRSEFVNHLWETNQAFVKWADRMASIAKDLV